MLKRIAEKHQEETISGVENARRYVEKAANSPKIKYNGFLKELQALNLKGDFLEIGAGPANLTVMIAEQYPGVNITAVEISAELVTAAREFVKQKQLEKRIRFVTGDACDEKMTGELGKFDLVFSSFTMHHWEDSEKTIRNLLECVKADGVLFIYDLKRVWWLYLLPFHNGFFNSIRASYKPREIRSMLKKLGLDQYKIKVAFPFFMQSIIIRK